MPSVHPRLKAYWHWYTVLAGLLLRMTPLRLSELLTTPLVAGRHAQFAPGLNGRPPCFT
jgi:hypothetical protein